MLLVEAKVGPFKSIDSAQFVSIEPQTTVLVGMNEAGKTVFLQALEKSNDALGIAKFNPVDDYPRKNLTAYNKTHKEKPSDAVTLTYVPSKEEIDQLNKDNSTSVKVGFKFNVTHKYDNSKTIGIEVDESHAIKILGNSTGLSSDAKTAILKAKLIREIPAALKSVSLTEVDAAFLTKLNERIAKASWDSVVQWEVWKWLERRIPGYLYFGEYDLLPSQLNLADLVRRIGTNDPKQLQPKHRAIQALLRMADISLAELSNPAGYETLKAKIESVSISLTDQIMAFWKQNEHLEVEVDIRNDASAEPPFDNGANLYLRIKNRKHRGVSTPFAQRSRGFIWFFSFLVWFDAVQHQLDASVKQQLILLLDEPGLALHALAQSDFLNYIRDLSKRHQVIYTTHSPFMVESDQLDRVRVVEDKDGIGSTISGNISSSDPRTIFPLQAALGWNIAQSLFINENNLLVEGPSELVYLKMVSAMLESMGREGLRDDILIVPVGGLDKVATFIALLGANGLKIAVLHDYRGEEQRLKDMVKNKIIPQKAILNASQFRDVATLGTTGNFADIEDIFDPSFYLDNFNKTFAKGLPKALKVSDLPGGDRIVERLEKHLETKKILLRPSGGFNHYLVASYMVSNKPSTLDDDSLKRFEALFKAVNSLFPKK